MEKPVGIIGYTGRMATEVRKLLIDEGVSFGVWGPDTPKDLNLKDLKDTAGVIDFSLPEATPHVLEAVKVAKVPWVCGTTGWKSDDEREALLRPAAEVVPVVVDSNFSLGVELLSQLAELLCKNLNQPFEMLDVHHKHKRDKPSGTAIKLRARIEDAGGHVSNIESRREGEVPGIHSIKVRFGDDILEVRHEAVSRKIFAEGAFRALKWAQGKSPGMYRMRDVLQ